MPIFLLKKSLELFLSDVWKILKIPPQEKVENIEENLAKNLKCQTCPNWVRKENDWKFNKNSEFFSNRYLPINFDITEEILRFWRIPLGSSVSCWISYQFYSQLLIKSVPILSLVSDWRESIFIAIKFISSLSQFPSDVSLNTSTLQQILVCSFIIIFKSRHSRLFNKKRSLSFR